MDFGGFNWALLTIVGVIVLASAILFAALRNRVSSARREESEGAVRRLYQEEDLAHRGEDNNVP
jgi:hypothetical protein